MTNFLPGIVTTIILLALLMFVSLGQQLHTSNPNMSAADLQNLTDSTQALWSNTSAKMMMSQPNVSTQFEARFVNVIYRVVDTFGYVAVEVANTGIEYGFQNPDFEAKQVSDALLILVYLEILVVIFVPTCAILYGIYLVLAWANEKLVDTIAGKKSKGVDNA